MAGIRAGISPCHRPLPAAARRLFFFFHPCLWCVKGERGKAEGREEGRGKNGGGGRRFGRPPPRPCDGGGSRHRRRRCCSFGESVLLLEQPSSAHRLVVGRR